MKYCFYVKWNGSKLDSMIRILTGIWNSSSYGANRVMESENSLIRFKRPKILFELRRFSSLKVSRYGKSTVKENSELVAIVILQF